MILADRRNAIDDLAAVKDRLDARGQEFADSLIKHFNRKGDLTSRQWPWVWELTKQATQPVQPKTVIGNLGKLQKLLDKARKRLKRPAIVLNIKGIGDVRVSVAGPQSKVPGSINVAENGRFGEAKWFGRILSDGTFDTGRKGQETDTLIEALRDFAEHPAERAAEHGKLTGRCCFCDLGLDSPESTAMGYGPVCAKNYGLPWGKKAAKAAGSVLA